MIFPTTRHGVGFDNGSRQPADDKQQKKDDDQKAADKSADDRKATDKSSKPGDDIEKGEAGKA